MFVKIIFISYKVLIFIGYKIWRRVKPLISDKGVESSKIAIADKKEEDKTEKQKIGDSRNEIISDGLDVTNTINKYFQNTITKLRISEYLYNIGTNTNTLGYPVDIALEKIKDHPNVKIVNENVCIQSLFHFTEISLSEMRTELASLN